MSFLGKTLSKLVSNATSLAKDSPPSPSGGAAPSQHQQLEAEAASARSDHTSSSSTRHHHGEEKSHPLFKSNRYVNNQDTQLTLNHLRKVFYEYLHPKQTGSAAAADLDQTGKDEKLYSILPLFIKAFGHSSLDDIGDRFSDVSEFCYVCSRLLVNEIGKRVKDELVLIKFFEIKTTEESADGYGLLNTVNLLASGPPFLVEIMARCTLPSRLVMCIYLFICLPEPKDSILDNSEFTAKERRAVFQKSFKQLMLKLCQHTATCNEFIGADALKLLFKIICSTYEQHNREWWKTAADALITLSRNLTLAAIEYLYKNHTIPSCLKAMDAEVVCHGNLIEKSELLISLLIILRNTSSLSQFLLDEFRSAGGYRIIVEMALKLEKERQQESFSIMLKKLLAELDDFTLAGFDELKISHINLNKFKMDGFQMPEPKGEGKTIRNVHAFQAFINIFNRAQSNELCLQVLDKIRHVYERDPCNYFILESKNIILFGLDETNAKLEGRDPEIQDHFIELIEYIVHGLNFIPCRELATFGLSIQKNEETKWNIKCAKFLFGLIKKNQVYKDAFRELGIFEILIACLHKFAASLKEKHVEIQTSIELDNGKKELGFLIMDMIACLLSHNISNTKLFRELGGARLAHNMVPYKVCRRQALSIVSALLLSTAGEDEMATLLGMMQTAPIDDLDLKSSVLRSLLLTLKESHRARTMFRKTGGFSFLISVILSMENCLVASPQPPWDKASKSDIFDLLKTILHTIVISMRYEPANAKFFEVEVKWMSLCSALRLVGCFDADKHEFESRANNDYVKRNFSLFESIFTNADDSFSAKSLAEHVQLSPSEVASTTATTIAVTKAHGKEQPASAALVYACYILHYLYETALDTFDKSKGGSSIHTFIHQTSGENLKKTAAQKASSSPADRPSPANLMSEDHLIVHPGALATVLHLLTSIKPCNNENLSSRLQFYVISLIKNLLKSERNQHIMSRANFINDILATCKHVLYDESHFLNASIQHIFERLAMQFITPKCLRDFILVDTLFEKPVELDALRRRDLLQAPLVPLNRIKSLITMTTPKDNRPYDFTSFVEFNMMIEGFGCLFLPSVFPQSEHLPTLIAMGMVSVGNEATINGGTGTGERAFPPQSGFTFSTWIYVDKFGSSSLVSAKQMHPIRLLTLVKNTKSKETLQTCLAVYLSPKNRSLFVSTEERPFQNSAAAETSADEAEPRLNDYNVKFNCSELFQEGQWLHIVLVWTRTVLKNSTVSLSVNANLIGTQRLNYINAPPSANSPNALRSVHAVIGTLPVLRLQSPVVWRQGGCYLFEEAVAPGTIASLYSMGPNYIGSFQSATIAFTDNTSNPAIIPEEKIVFGLHVNTVFEVTLAKFRKKFNKNDSKVIGKLLNIPTNENVTPLRILPNTAAQLNGLARSIGGIVIGYLGVRTFQPLPVSRTIENIGGVYFLLGLVAIANDTEYMYATVKILICIIKSNREIAREMIRLNGYQLLAMLYMQKIGLINAHVLNLTCSLVVSEDAERDHSSIRNLKAFEHLLCDMDVWYGASNEVQRLLFDRFNELLCERPANVKVFHRFNMLKRLLFMIKTPPKQTSNEFNKYALRTIKLLVIETTETDDYLKLGQFLASLLPERHMNENNLLVETPDAASAASAAAAAGSSESSAIAVYNIYIRNKIINVINEITTQNTCTKSITFQEDFQRVLGYDWFLLFLQPNVHRTTVVKVCKILYCLLLNVQNLNRFKDASYCGNWLSNITSRHNHARLHIQSSEGSFFDSGSPMAAPLSELARTNSADREPRTPNTANMKSFLNLRNAKLISPGLGSTSMSSVDVPDAVGSPSSAGGSGGGAGGAGEGHELNLNACMVPGFQLMQTYFAELVDVVELYFLLFALLLDAQRINELPVKPKLDLNSICKYVFDKSFDSEQTLFCKINMDVGLDITVTLLAMIRTLMNPLKRRVVVETQRSRSDEPGQTSQSPMDKSVHLEEEAVLDDSLSPAEKPSPTASTAATTVASTAASRRVHEPYYFDEEATKDYAIILLQIFRYMYHNCEEFRSVAFNADFLVALIQTLYPYEELSEEEQTRGLADVVEPFSGACCSGDAASAAGYRSYLTVHVGRKLVIDFLRDLIYDNLTNSNYSHKSQTVDAIMGLFQPATVSAASSSLNTSSSIESQGRRPSRRDQEFITELLKTMMDYLPSTDVFNGDQLQAAVIVKLQNLVDNIICALWSGDLRRKPQEVFDFIMKIIANQKRKHSGTSIEPLVDALNSTLLFQLSRPIGELAEKISVLDALHKITTHKSLIFSATDNEQEFYACLTHCLLTAAAPPSSSSGQEPVSPGPPPSSPGAAEAADEQDPVVLVNKAAERVWLDLYLSKKSVLEESMKVNLNSIGKTPTLEQLRPILSEPAERVWAVFVEREKRPPEKLQNHLHAKFQRITTMAGGFSRVVSLKKTRKEIPRLKAKELKDSIGTINSNLEILKDFVNFDFTKTSKASSENHGFLLEEWHRIEKSLLRERGIFGYDDSEGALDKWKLDFTEGPSRQRKRMLANTHDFYEHYPYRAELESTKPNKKYKIPSSYDAKAYLEKFRMESMLNYQERLAGPDHFRLRSFVSLDPDAQAETSTAVVPLRHHQPLSKNASDSHLETDFKNRLRCPDAADMQQIKKFSSRENLFPEDQTIPAPLRSPTAVKAKTPPAVTAAAAAYSSNKSNQNILRLLEEGERINHIFRCARVKGLDTSEGVFLFGKEHFYVLDGFTLISTKDIVDIDSLNPMLYEPLIPKSSTGTCTTTTTTTTAVVHKELEATNSSGIGEANKDPSSPLPRPRSARKEQIKEKACSKFSFEQIKEVHKRRYLLQEIAIEIFSNDGRNYLLVFSKKCRNKVYERLIALCPDLSDSAHQSIAGQRLSTNIEQNAGILNSLMGEKSVVQRWERGEINNFQYLMCLNTLAGRSYNDLMQYPVFPWVLADYDSEELNLCDPNTFRDFSKPMGAQTPDRLVQYQKRFYEWEDPTGETPPYHYGTHYSSAMIVASYLLRLEPFTQIFLRLQGGHFDLADRLFHSVKENWLSASKNNMADVKELIPEFFYLPEFLTNSNRFNLGAKQNGDVIDHVVLPPWAKGDPREFIRVHRMALESDYVSAHLNEWIDLIFGFKQQGQPAVDSTNVFHHLFYEGAVDIDSIDDPLKRNAIIGFINNFGQIPKQLFKKAHPVRKLNSQWLYGLPANTKMTGLGSSVVSQIIMNNVTGSAASPAASAVAAAAGQSSSGQKDGASSFQRPGFGLPFIYNIKSLRPVLQPVKELKAQIGQIAIGEKGLVVVEKNKFVIPPAYQRYVGWDYADQSIRLGLIDYDKFMFIFENLQEGTINCACSLDMRTVITAGSSTTVNVWEISRSKPPQLILKNRLFGHKDEVTAMALSNSYHMLVTGSSDLTCIIWDINRMTFVRQLDRHSAPITCVSINDLTGDIVTAAGSHLYVWSINGQRIADIETVSESSQSILSICQSQINEWDPVNVILTGGTDGVVKIWNVEYNRKYNDEHEEIREEAAAVEVEPPSSPKEALNELNESSTSPSEEPASKPEAEEPPPPVQPTSDGAEEAPEGVEKNEAAPDAASVEKEAPEVPTEVVSPTIKEPVGVVEKPTTATRAYEWECRIVLKSRLLVNHDKDDPEVPSITALAISKDHRTIYAGDSRGKVFSWTCAYD